MEIIKSLSEINDYQDRIRFLIENKRAIKSAKKNTFKTFAPISTTYSRKSKSATKMLNMDIGEGEFFIVGNSIGFFDSHSDVSMKGSWDKTVRERGNSIPIIKDHRMLVENLFAKNLGTSIQSVPIRDLNYDKEGETDVLGALIKPIDEDMSMRYENGLIKEHSVGLWYQDLRLAVNDPESEGEYKVWTENIDKVINKEDAEGNGFFWAVFEQKLIEISAVVLGSNPYTPALKQDSEPPKNIRNDPPNGNRKSQDYSILLELKR